ncbi:hypothetical protein SAMN05421763_11528 [[Luteovulum] sphaeroides subsp. megalophilum]|uniref:hypothetical protein n=1 Tax=Cereibacter sphaeroides TaxID=1063 RepID=UPI000B629DFC|nr:hypothetical protein [Cereibacter sphaeroides]SNT40898.1 hypothetical protein SAMN05421763_11528 [[Luteovulum] sphaeroides subsp. megalophilum]
MLDKHKALARHALGLSDLNTRIYRNRFVTGPGSDDYEEWMHMVGEGMARRFKGSALSGGNEVFILTRKGAQAALNPGETLDAEDFPKEAA